MILDSGSRQEFTTGAVRDIQEGKGRCDLLPLDVVAIWITHSPVLARIRDFKTTGEHHNLIRALEAFCSDRSWDVPTMLLEVSKQFEDGAKKYGENNWQKGIPTKRYIDSAIRHYLKWCRGDEDEPHDRAFCWNVIACIWTCLHKPELHDYQRVPCPVCGKSILSSDDVCPHCLVHVGEVNHG